MAPRSARSAGASMSPPRHSITKITSWRKTLSFNLLMGRQWPPHHKDLAEAEAIFRELGLGGLLARMPAGMEQVVGETGWQLSQGERSRLPRTGVASGWRLDYAGRKLRGARSGESAAVSGICVATRRNR